MADPLRFVVEVDGESEPIRGSVQGPGGRNREYLGWLALIDLLEEWRHRPAVEEEQWPVSPPS